MSRFSSIVRGQLTKSDEKKAALARASQQKRDELNPAYAINIGNVDILDADTVRDKFTGDTLRLGGGVGNDFDAYESSPFGYDQNPVKEAIHKQSYADAFGVNVGDVTREMLLERGQLQKAQFAERLAGAADENGNIRYRRRGVDNNNRVIADIEENVNTAQFLDQSGNRDENAGYKGQFNFLRTLEDFQSGDTIEHNFGRGERTKTDVLKDSAIGLTAGAGDMVNSLAQTVAVGLGQGKETAEFFESNREGLQGFRKDYQSPEKTRGDRLAGKRSEQRRAISSMKKAQYVADGDSEIVAGTKAGIDEAVDAMQDFWRNPGRALDSAVESLPYMFGVGAVGGQAARIASNKIKRELLESITKGAGKAKAKKYTKEELSELTAKAFQSKPIQDRLRKVVDRTGISTVGITEGMTNSAEVYAEIMRLSEEDAMQSEKYQALRFDEGMSHEDALHELGVSAYAESLVMTTILASAAAAGTGAGAFEGRLFTGITNPAKKKVTKTLGPKKFAKGREKVIKRRADAAAGVKPSVAQRLKPVVALASKGATKIGKKPFSAGAKETVEETIQSGGGELIGQITSQEATGEEIGPGVGSAAAEGAVVGFVSGAGISAITDGAKGIFKKILNPKTTGDDADTATATGEGGVTVGGDRNLVNEQLREAEKKKDFNPAGSFQELYNSIQEDLEAGPEKTTGAIFRTFNMAEALFHRAMPQLAAKLLKAEASGDADAIKTATEDVAAFEDAFGKLNKQYKTGLLRGLQEQEASHKEGKFGPGDFALLEEASLRGIPIDPEVKTAAGEAMGRVFQANIELSKQLELLNDTEALNETIQSQIEIQGLEDNPVKAAELRVTMLEAHNSKMGNLRSFIPGVKEDVPGLERLVYEVSDALTRNLQRRAEGLTTHLVDTFIPGQQKKIDFLKNQLKKKNPKKTFEMNGVTYNWHEEGIKKLLNQLEIEQAQMVEVGTQLQAKVAAYGDARTEQANATKAAQKAAKKAAKAEVAEDEKTKAAKLADKAKKFAKGIVDKLDKLTKGKVKAVNTAARDAATKLKEKIPNHKLKVPKLNKATISEKLQFIQDANILLYSQGEVEGSDTPPEGEDGGPQGEPDDAYTKDEIIQKYNVAVAEAEALSLKGQLTSGQKKRLAYLNAEINRLDSLLEVIADQEIGKGEPNKLGRARGKQIARAAYAAIEGKNNLKPMEVFNKLLDVEDNVELSELEAIGFSQEVTALVERHKEARDAKRDPNAEAELDVTLRNLQSVVSRLQASLDNNAENPIEISTWARYLESLRDNEAIPEAVKSRLNEFHRNTGTDTAADLADRNTSNADLQEIISEEIKFAQEEAKRLVEEYTDNPAEQAQKLQPINNMGEPRTFPQTDKIKSTVELETDPNNIDDTESAPVGASGVIERLKTPAHQRLTNYVNYLVDVLGEEIDTDIQNKIRGARKGLRDLDNPIQTPKELDTLIRQVESMVEEQLRYAHYDSLAQADEYYRDALQHVAEMGMNGTMTDKFRKARDSFLKNLTREIATLEASNTDRNEIINKVISKTQSFQETHTAYDNAFLSGGMRYQGNDSQLHDSTDFFMQEAGRGENKQTLPARLSDGFVQSNTKHNSYLALFPNWISALKLEAQSETGSPEWAAKDLFLNFEDQFGLKLRESLPKWGKKSPSTQSIFYQKGTVIGDIISEDPLWYFRDNAGNLNANLVTAMALETFKYMTGAGQRTISNDEEEVRKILGKPEGYIPNEHEMNELGYVGDSIETVYDMIGNNVMRHMNIKGNGLSTGQIRSIMPRVMGAHAIATLKTMGVVDLYQKDLVKIETGKASKEMEGYRSFLRLETQPAANGVAADEFSFYIQKLTQASVTLSRSGEMENMFGLMGKAEMPSFTKFEKVRKSIARTAMDAPKDLQEGMQADQDRPLGVNTVLEQQMRLFGTDIDYLEVLHGIVPTLESVPLSMHKNIRGRNGNFIRDFNLALEWIATMEQAGVTKFYVPNRAITNFRTMMVNTIANPQASKVHRALFPKAENILEYPATMSTATAIDNEMQTAFYRSVLQKLDVKVDFMSDADVLKQVDARIADFQKLIDHIKNPDEEVDGKPRFNPAQIADFKAMELDGMENSETYMTLANLAALQTAAESGDTTPLNLYQPVQSDAVAAGAATTLVQQVTTENLDRSVRDARKYGITITGDSFTAAGFLETENDAYKTITVHLHKVLDAMEKGDQVKPTEDGVEQLGTTEELIAEKGSQLNDLLTKVPKHAEDAASIKNDIYRLRLDLRRLLTQADETMRSFGQNTLGDGKGVIEAFIGPDGKVTGAGRNFAKFPFMLGNYNSGRENAKRSVAVDAYNAMLVKLGTINDPDELRTALLNITIARNNMVTILKDTGLRKGDKWTLHTAEQIDTQIEEIEAERAAYYAREERGGRTPDVYNLGTRVNFSPESRYAIQQIFSDIYGEPLALALDTELGYKERVRNSLHAMAYISNRVFTEILEQRIADFHKQYKFYPDQIHIQDITDQMVAEGLFPAVKGALSQSTNDRIEAVKRTSQGFVINGEAVIGRIGFENNIDLFTEAPEGTTTSRKTLGFGIEDRTFKESPGVAPAVRTIQSQEGTIQQELLRDYPMTNTYDGQGISGILSRQASQQANKGFIKYNYEYNMVEAFFDNMVSMLRALHPVSSQLSAETKADILKEMLASKTLSKLVKRERGQTDRATFDGVLENLNTIREDVLTGRQEFWEQVRAVDNYMGSGHSEVHAAAELKHLEASPSIYTVVNPSMKDLVAAQREEVLLVDNAKKAVITALSTSIPEGIPAVEELLQRIIRQNPNKRIGLGYLLDVLNQSFSKTAGNDTLTTVIRIVQEQTKGNTDLRGTADAEGVSVFLENDPIIVMTPGGLEEKANGVYEAKFRGRQAKVRIWAGAPNLIHTILHEGLHAVTVEYLDRVAENSDPTAAELSEFDQIVAQGITITERLMRKHRATRPGIYAFAATLQAQLESLDTQQQISAMSELLSYVITEFEPDQKLDLLMLEQFRPTLEILNTLKEAAKIVPPTNSQAQASAAKTNAEFATPVVSNNSSDEDIDTVAFMERYVTRLPGDQISQVIEDINKLELVPQDPEHNTYLDGVLDRIVVPGMRTISPLTVLMSTNPNGTRNVGKVVGDTVYLEAAGNPLTSNVDMSLKETMVHEYLHPIIGWALGDNTASGDVGDWNTQREVEKIFNHVHKELTEKHGGWRVFMPPAGQVTGNQAYAEEQAKRRWNYIFENQDGNQLTEFFINGLVNKPLIAALARMDSPNTVQPIWAGATLKTLQNILGRIFRLLQTSTTKSKVGKVHADLEALAGHIISINMQNMSRVKHKEMNTLPRMDSVNNWISDQIGRKIADPLNDWASNNIPTPGESTLVDLGYTSLVAMLESENAEFNESADQFYRSLLKTRNNDVAEILEELTPDLASKRVWKKQLRKSNHTVDRARRSAIEDMMGYLRGHFDKSTRHKLRSADKAALTNVGMRTDLSALLGTGANFERLQILINSEAAVDREIAIKRQQLINITKGDNKLYNSLHNQVTGLAQLMIHGTTKKANVQKNVNAIANQYYFTNVQNRRTLADVAGTEAILNELKSVMALKILHETAPDDIANAQKVVNHEMSRKVALNGFAAFMNMHRNFKTMSKKRLFDDNPTQMIDGYVYEQFNPDIDMKFTAENDTAGIAEMERKNYQRIGLMARDPADPLLRNSPRMIMWKGLDGNAMYMKMVVSPTDTDHRGQSLYDSNRLNGMHQGTAAKLAKYNIQVLRNRMERDTLQQQFNPDVNSTQDRVTPVLDINGKIVNYTYEMSRNHKQEVLEANQDFDYLLGRMFGSIEDKINSQVINSESAKLLYQEYKAGRNNENLRFVEISKYSKDPKVKEMWDLIPEAMKEELTQLFGGEHFYIRDDIINLVLGFRKFSIANGEWLGKSAFTVRSAERIWMDVIKLLKIKIVLTMPDVVIGNMASNLAILLARGIPPQFIYKEFKAGLKGIYRYQKDEKALHDLRQEMVVSTTIHGAPKAAQITQEKALIASMANNPINVLAGEGVFTGIADEIEPDTWNWRNKVMQKFDETGEWIPSAMVSAAKEVMIVPGAQTFKVALAATQYADFIARHIQFKYDVDVRGKDQELAIQDAINSFIYYDVPQNVWLQYGNDMGFLMFTKYFFRIQQIIYQLYRQNPASAFSVLALQKMSTSYPVNSNIMDYAFLDNFNFASRLHMFPLATMDRVDMLTPSLLQIILNPFGGDK